jgi:cell division protein FtsI (penicillin-binding protein 3)
VQSASPDGDFGNNTVVLGDGPLVTVPDFSGWAARRVALECEKLGLDLNVVGSGLAAEQNPVAGIKVPAGTKIWVRMAR